MRFVPNMVDMRRTSEEKTELSEVSQDFSKNVNDYPYGLSICFTNAELEKLDLDACDVEVGDMVHLHCLAKVTSVSQTEVNGEKQSRIEMVLAHIAAEDEGEEDEEAEQEMGGRRPYR
jgi:hypothetical protein